MIWDAVHKLVAVAGTIQSQYHTYPIVRRPPVPKTGLTQVLQSTHGILLYPSAFRLRSLRHRSVQRNTALRSGHRLGISASLTSTPLSAAQYGAPLGASPLGSARGIASTFRHFDFAQCGASLTSTPLTSTPLSAAQCNAPLTSTPLSAARYGVSRLRNLG